LFFLVSTYQTTSEGDIATTTLLDPIRSRYYGATDYDDEGYYYVMYDTYDALSKSLLKRSDLRNPFPFGQSKITITHQTLQGDSQQPGQWRMEHQ
jgi:hypothetical protein